MRSRIIDDNRPAVTHIPPGHSQPLYPASQPSSQYGYYPQPQPHHHQANGHYSRPKQHSKPARRLPPLAPSEGWLVLFLLGIALYSVVYSIIGADWIPDHSSLLLVSPMVGMLVGVAIAKIPRFPQAILHLAACLIGHWLAIWLTSSIAFHVPWTLVLSDLRAAFTGQLLAEGLQASQIIFFFYLTFLCFFLGYFGSWLIYRAHLPWLVALVYGSILLVNLNYVRQQMPFLVLVMAGALILLVARMQLVSQITQWTREGLHTDQRWMRAIVSRCMSAACLIATLTLLFGWFLPTPVQPESGKAFWDHLDSAWNNLLNGHLSWQDINSLVSTQQDANFFGDRLTVTDSVHLPSGQVLNYRSSDNLPHYLEGFSYNNFDGRTWTTTTDASKAAYYGSGAILPVDSSMGGDNGTLTINMVLPPDGTKHYIFGPAQPIQFDTPIIVYGDATASAWVKQGPLTHDETYHVIFTTPSNSASLLSSLPLPDTNGTLLYSNGSPVPDSYYQVPAGLSSRVEQTAHQWTQGAQNMYQALKMLESHLSDTTNFTYSTTNPPVPPGRDVIDWLLQTKKGYCTYYATAMAVMARQLHIPTRIVNGFSQGHFDQSRKVWEVDGSDAHSWVQAYFSNIGWVNFDPTPTFSQGATPSATPTPQPNPSPVPTQKPVKPGVTPTPAPKITPTLPAGTHPQGPNPPHGGSTPFNDTLVMSLSLGIVLLSLLFCLAAFLRYRWRNLYANNTFVASMFWRFCHLASWVGLAPHRSQTPYEYSGMLTTRFPQQAAPLWHLTELFVRDRWGPPTQTPVPQEVERVERLWPSLRSLLFTSLLNRVKKRHP